MAGQVPKVIMLSHSSRENLTRDWKRTTVLTVDALPCHPCHRLHYGDRYCHVDPESHAALCAFMIDPGRVFDAISHYYPKFTSGSRFRADLVPSIRGQEN